MWEWGPKIFENVKKCGGGVKNPVKKLNFEGKNAKKCGGGSLDLTKKNVGVGRSDKNPFPPLYYNKKWNSPKALTCEQMN